MTHNPTFTVVIPLYNTERHIAAALNSVLAQTCQDFEVLVVDDGSTDGGTSVARSYADSDPRIQVVTQENRGLAGARNTGIRHARGQYIALLDADDLWSQQKLALHKEHLDAHPDVGVSFSASAFIDEHGAAMGIAQQPKLSGIDAEHVFCRNPVGNGSAAVLRTAMLVEMTFWSGTEIGTRTCWFDETFRQSEDIELWTRIAATTRWRFEGLGQQLTLYRVNNGGLSADVDKQLASWERVVAKLKEYCPDLAQKAGGRARAYQMRYLARRAIVSGEGFKASRMLWSALRGYPRMILEEPVKTFATAAFCIAGATLPHHAFRTIKTRIFSRMRQPAQRLA